MTYLVLLAGLATTVLIEGTIVWVITQKWTFVYYGLLCNLLTNPALNLVLLIAIHCWGLEYYFIVLIPLEVIVIFIEADIYRRLCRFTIKRALGVSLLANATSFSAGLLWFMAF